MELRPDQGDVNETELTELWKVGLNIICFILLILYDWPNFKPFTRLIGIDKSSFTLCLFIPFRKQRPTVQMWNSIVWCASTIRPATVEFFAIAALNATMHSIIHWMEIAQTMNCRHSQVIRMWWVQLQWKLSAHTSYRATYIITYIFLWLQISQLIERNIRLEKQVKLNRGLQLATLFVVLLLLVGVLYIINIMLHSSGSGYCIKR